MKAQTPLSMLHALFPVPVIYIPIGINQNAPSMELIIHPISNIIGTIHNFPNYILPVRIGPLTQPIPPFHPFLKLARIHDPILIHIFSKPMVPITLKTPFIDISQ
jgi:hypothetical protein